MGLILINNLKDSYFKEKIKKLISFAVFNPSDERISKLFTEVYFTKRVHLYLFEVNDEVVGLIGIRREGIDKAEILHIAVDIPHRNHGYGKQMIKTILNHEEINFLFAETDIDARGFYQKCGFEIKSIGEKYPDVERFICELERKHMKLVFIFGPQAVGKMTVGQELEKITELKLFHNHMTIELLYPYFGFSEETWRLSEE